MIFKFDIFVYILYFGFLFIYIFSKNPKIITTNKDFYKTDTIFNDCKGKKYKFICENKEENNEENKEENNEE